jgi:hypothetical protein
MLKNIKKKKLKLMKKILFVLGVFAVLSFTACNATSDCECVVDMYGDGAGRIIPMELEVRNFEGDCDDVDWNDLPLYLDEEEVDIIISIECKEE